MRTICIILLIALIGNTAYAQDPEAGSTQYVTVASSNPDAVVSDGTDIFESEPLGTLLQNQSVTVLDSTDGEYVMIRAVIDGKTVEGWVKKRILSPKPIENTPRVTESGSIDSDTYAGPGTVSPGLPAMDSLWKDIDLTGESMKPFFVTPLPDKTSSPLIPILIGVTGAGVATYFIVKNDGEDGNCSFSASVSATSSACELPNGSVTVTVSPPDEYTYQWSNGSTDRDLQEVVAGAYTVTITRTGTTCMQVLSASVTNVDQPITTDISIQDADCGMQNGSVTISVFPPAFYTYTWSNGSTEQNQSQLSPGNYMLTVTAAGTCMETYNITVGELPPTFNISFQTSPSTCGFPDGSAIAIVVPKNEYEYVWSDGQTGALAENLVAGTYTVTVTIAGTNCSKEANVTVNELTANFTLTITSTPAGCGISDGTATVIANPPGTYTYTWSNGQNGTQATNLAAGSHNVTVSIPGTNCSKDTSVTVTELPPAFTINISTTPAGCGLSDGTATATINPPGNYEYTWSNGQTGNQATGLVAGSYNITVTVAGSTCRLEASTLIEQLPPPFTVSVSSTPAGCGQADGMATVTVNPPGNYEYTWSNGQTGNQLSGVGAGSYNVTVTIVGSTCSQEASITIEELPPTFTVSVSSTPAGCGLADGTANVMTNPPGSYNYIWSNGQTGTQATGLMSGSYTVTVSIAGSTCSQETSVNVEQLPPFFSLSFITTPSGCGLSTGSATVIVDPPGTYTYLWSNGSVEMQITNVSSGDYTVTVTIGGTMCSSIGTVNVDQTGGGFTATFVTDNASCGLSNGSAIITVNPPAEYTYLWSNQQTGTMIEQVATGTYSVTVTDINSCTESFSVTVGQDSAEYINILNTTPGNCIGGGNISFTVITPGAGPMDVVITGPSGTNNLTLDNGVYNLSSFMTVFPGMYTFMVTDQGIGPSCTETVNVTVSDNTPPLDLLDDFYTTGGTQPVEENALDNDEGLNIQMTQVDNEVGGTVTFTSNGDFVFTADIGFSGEASFYYTVTDACGNTSTAFVNIFVEEISCDIEVEFESTPATCGLEDGEITVIVIEPGSYEYEWSNGDFGPTIQNIPPGNYTVTITDLNLGCTLESTTVLDGVPSDYIDDIIIIQPNCEAGGDIHFTAISPSGNPLVLSVTHPNGSAEFSIDAGFIRLSDYVSTVPGDYFIEVSDPETGPGCFESFEATLNTPPILEIVLFEVIPPSEPTAMDGIAVVDVTQPGQFPYAVYLNGMFIFTVFQNNFNVLGLGVGSYTVQVIDVQGCQSNILQFEVPFPDEGYSFGAGIVQSSLPNKSNEQPGVLQEDKIWRRAITGSYLTNLGDVHQEIRLLYALPVKSLRYGYLKGYIDLEVLSRLKNLEWGAFGFKLQGGFGGHLVSDEQKAPGSSAPSTYWLGRMMVAYEITKRIHLNASITIRGWEKVEPIHCEFRVVLPFYTWYKSRAFTF